MLRQFSVQRVGTTALSRTHFLLLYAAMLVAAAGNTALQSVMPAIGRESGISAGGIGRFGSLTSA